MAAVNVLLVEINPFVPVSTPISLGYIAAFLESKGFKTRILTIGQDTPMSRVDIEALLREFQPALVGLSAYQRTMLYVLGFAGLVKSVNADIKVAIGGPQATFMPTEALREMPEVDYLCRSSGEVTLQTVAEAIRAKTPFTGLAGVSYQNAAGLFDTPALVGFSDLDEYPSPYLNDVFDYSAMGEAIMLTSRGCPHNCIFCYTPQAFQRKIRFHSIDRVVEEIKWINKRGIHRLWFADPNISYRWERVEELLDRVMSEGLQNEIWLQTRADLVTPPMMKMMKRAGVGTIAFGLESASKRVLSRLGKHISTEQVADAIRLAQSHGVDVELFTIFGLPYETMADAIETIEFVKRNGVKIRGNTNSQPMQIYFGTHMAENYESYGIRPLNDKRPAYVSIGSQYETDTMGPEEMKKIQGLWRSESLDRGRRIVS
jgi:radical SAM superfamily enzyme YgiQ (UPF0313 family)